MKKEKFINLLEYCENPIFIKCLVTNKLLLVNKKARDLFSVSVKNCDFQKIFVGSNLDIETVINDNIVVDKNSFIYDLVATKSDNEQFLVDLNYWYVDNDMNEIYIELISKVDTRMKTALSHMQRTSRAEAIVNFDDTLSIIDCNDAFHKVFESNSTFRTTVYNNSLINAFFPDVREQLIKDIFTNLKDGFVYSTKTKVLTTSGEYYWYLLELERYTLDDSGVDKFVVNMTNIEKQVELENVNSKFKQYLSNMQDLTQDILYHIDYVYNENDNTTETLFYHNIEGDFVKKYGDPIKNYVDIFYVEEIIHIDDQEHYRNCLKRFNSKKVTRLGHNYECVIRLRLLSDEYLWYSVRAKKVFDENGTLISVIGAMVNVENEKKIEHEFTTVNQYFKALQAISGESFYTVDIKRKVLKQTYKIADELGLSIELGNFPESYEAIVHEDDLTKFKAFVDDSITGIPGKVKLRILTKEREYNWYEMYAEIVYDEQCEVSEFVGKMINVQKQMELELRATRDPLTDVLNKGSYENQVTSILNESRIGQKHALIFIDLDDFKGINDNLGHSFGDFLLKTVTNRVKKLVRESDVIGRIGGDEFSVFLKNIRDESFVLTRVNLILESLNEQFTYEGKTAIIKASFGVAISPQAGNNYKTLYENSDKALYVSKNKGKNIVTLYTNELK